MPQNRHRRTMPACSAGVLSCESTFPRASTCNGQLRPLRVPSKRSRKSDLPHHFSFRVESPFLPPSFVMSLRHHVAIHQNVDFSVASTWFHSFPPPFSIFHQRIPPNAMRPFHLIPPKKPRHSTCSTKRFAKRTSHIGPLTRGRLAKPIPLGQPPRSGCTPAEPYPPSRKEKLTLLRTQS